MLSVEKFGRYFSARQSAGTVSPGILISLICGAVAGWLAGPITKGRGFGVLGNMTAGKLGGILSGLLWRGKPGPGHVGSVFTAMIGAIVLLFVVGGLVKSSRQ